MAGFKKFPHDWRKRVFRELKGIRLAVWMYHWSRSGKDDTVRTTLDQLAADLPYCKSRIVKARGELRKAGWLVVEEETYRNEKGYWTVPVYRPVIPETVSAFPASAKTASAEGADRTETPKAATAKRAATVDTQISVDTTGSDASRLPVNTSGVGQSASQPSACGAVRLGQISHTVDQLDEACRLSEKLCKKLNLEWETSYAGDFLPLVVTYPVEEIHKVLNSPVLRKPYWQRDLSSVKQFVWRFESNGEDSLRAQVRQEESIARALRRTEIERKVRKRQSLTPDEQVFRIADLYFNYGWHDSSIFPDEALFVPLYEELKDTASDIVGKIDEAVSWGWNRGYQDWIKENLFPTPELFVQNLSAFREIIAPYCEEVLVRNTVEEEEL